VNEAKGPGIERQPEVSSEPSVAGDAPTVAGRVADPGGTSAAASARTAVQTPPPSPLPSRIETAHSSAASEYGAIGRYNLVRKLGEGGTRTRQAAGKRDFVPGRTEHPQEYFAPRSSGYFSRGISAGWSPAAAEELQRGRAAVARRLSRLRQDHDAGCIGEEKQDAGKNCGFVHAVESSPTPSGEGRAGREMESARAPSRRTGASIEIERFR
jgi:hypothetical protein